MSDGYRVNPNGLLDTGAELDSVTQQLRHSLGDLDRAVTGFSQANAGRAVDGYRQAHDQWQAGLDKMQHALAKAKRSLDEIHQRYVLADNRGAAMFGGTV